MVQNSKIESQPEDPRVRFAAERTVLAWVRTGLAMMGFGFVVARFGVFLREISRSDQTGLLPSTGLSLWIGAGLILLGIAVNVTAAIQHIHILRDLDRGRPFTPPKWSLAVFIAFILAAIGIGMMGYLLTLPIIHK